MSSENDACTATRRDGAKRAKIYEGDDATRMIYLDSRSPSLNDSRPGATGCSRRLLSCVAVSARLQRLCLEGCHYHQAATEAAESATGGWRDISPAVVSTRRDEYGRLWLPPVVHLPPRSRCIGDTLEWPFHGHWFLTLVNHSLKKIFCEIPLCRFLCAWVLLLFLRRACW